MKREFQVLKGTGLFEGVEPEEMKAMFRCVDASTSRFSKDDYLFRKGARTNSLAIIIEGRARSFREDWWGERRPIDEYGPGSVIGTESACSDRRIDMSVIALEPTEVLFLDVDRISHTCQSSCPFHHRMISNLIRILAQGSKSLNVRLDEMARRTTREKLCAFLSDQAAIAGSGEFTISMNRQELADHLGVDRSAMSAELSRMQKDGIIEYERNTFRLK